jgi:hypothetical protein
MAKQRAESDRQRLRELIEEATIDCYDEEEELSGLWTMIADNMVCPFRARVVGEEVTVTGFAWPQHGHGFFAVCERNGKQHRVDLNSLEWIEPRPAGFEWIEAYFAWLEGGV